MHGIQITNSGQALMRFASFAFFLVTLVGIHDPLHAQTGGDATVLTVEGNKVEVKAVGTTTWKLALPGTVLQTREVLRTGFKSRATLRYSDQSVIRIDQLTTLEIEPPKSGQQKPVLNLTKGAAYLFNRDQPTEIQFKTPVASGAIRGTEFNLQVAEDGRTVVTLLDGEVDLTNELGEVNLKSGDQGSVEKGKAPTRTSVLDAINIIQWSLYYPGVLHLGDINLPADSQSALSESLAAYRSGDLLQASAKYPENRQPGNDAEKLYSAALLLAAGQVPQAELQLAGVNSPLVGALKEAVAAVKNQTFERGGSPTLASEWVAHSYYLQSKGKLPEALKAARSAAEKAPDFGFAWVRVAELEFGFGRTAAMQTALDKAIAVSPRNAQAISLKGFVLAANNKTAEAISQFDQAIAIDGALGNAWLGRGLCLIRQGKKKEGRQDIQTAASLEPNRAVLRSYLGKAFSNERDPARARKELDLAKKLDLNDPTSWLYSALLGQQDNRLNDAVTDLEKSQELNDNRRIYRSRLLLDQDRAVRGANLAAIYRDNGMTDWSVREASKAVNADPANASAHLFLANSYDALRDPRQINLRYDTPWLSELLLANLLSPVGGGSLSQNVSQQEYSKLFDGSRVGLSSSTEYTSGGNWVQSASQFGNYGDIGYALDAHYRTDNGQRPNNDIETLTFVAKVKYSLTPKDTLLVQAIYYDADSGDVRQYYNQASASQTFRFKERQEPNVFVGLNHEWNPSNHTLLFAGRLDDTLRQNDSQGKFVVFNSNPVGQVTGLFVRTNDFAYKRQLEAYTAELQHLFQHDVHSVIVGGRYQTGKADTSYNFNNTFIPNQQPEFNTDIERVSAYAYYYWQLHPTFQITAGVNYDRLTFPQNIELPPLSLNEDEKDQFSPKAGFIYTPLKDTTLRGLYTRSLGGVYFDGTYRIEPTQLSGFNQAYRSLIPESVTGSLPGSEFETWNLAVDQSFSTRTYITLGAEVLKSTADTYVGAVENNFLKPRRNLLLRESLGYEEKSVSVAVSQLLGDGFSVGATYRVSQASLNDHFPDMAATLKGNPSSGAVAVMHQLNLYGIYNHRCGFFAQAGTVWTKQSNQHYVVDLPGDDFWQGNIFVGYRMAQRRVEVRLGILNVGDVDYKLNPLNFYLELPRERTFVASLKLNF